MFRNFLKILLFVLLFSTAVLAKGELKLVAPGGGEVDLQKNVMRYYADGSNLVVADWGNFKLEAESLEYQNEKGTLQGKGKIKLTQKEPYRELRSEQFLADLNRDHFNANGSVKIKYDNITNLSGEQMDWESQTEEFNIIGNVVLNYSGWKMTGEKIEGNMNSGLFVIFGPVQAIDRENSMRAGRVIFDRSIERVTLLENPVVINGKNELSGAEIIYDLKTKKVSASGVVKSRVIE
jgi:lipopolysaccharide export system protein LptA